MATEIELKLSIAAQQIEALTLAPPLQQAQFLGERYYQNTYYDTPALDLHHQRIAIRIRDTGRGLVQTIKCASTSVNGLSARPEWEQPYTGQFDFTSIDDLSVQAQLTALSAQLIPVFTTHFQRRTWAIDTPEGAEMHLMLDQGEVVAGSRHEAISEVELELVSGTPESLTQFANILSAYIELNPCDISKAQRGFLLRKSA